MALEELEVIDLASERLVNATVDKVVSAAVLKFLSQSNLHDHAHRILRDKSTRLSDDANLPIVCELLFYHLTDLGRYHIEVVLGIFSAHRETASDVENIKLWHLLFLCHFKDDL